MVRDASDGDARVVTELYVASANTAWREFEACPPREVTDERVARWQADLGRARYHRWVAEVGPLSSWRGRHWPEP